MCAFTNNESACSKKKNVDNEPPYGKNVNLQMIPPCRTKHGFANDSPAFFTKSMWIYKQCTSSRQLASGNEFEFSGKKISECSAKKKTNLQIMHHCMCRNKYKIVITARGWRNKHILINYYAWVCHNKKGLRHSSKST